MENFKISDGLKAYIKAQRREETKGETAQILADAYATMYYARIHLNQSTRLDRMVENTERVLAEFSLLLDLMREGADGKEPQLEPQRGENMYG